MTNTPNLFTLWAPCCHTRFEARTQEEVIDAHRAYHNAQFRKGRREEPI